MTLSGIVGYLCPELLLALSNLPPLQDTPLISTYGYLATDSYSNVFYVTPSHHVIIEAIFGLMNIAGWNQLVVITELVDKQFIGIAKSLLQVASRNAYINVSQFTQIGFHIDGSQILTSLKSKVIFVSASAAIINKLLCEALRMGVTWPEYAWILYGYQQNYFIQSFMECHYQKAFEGVILFQQNLANSTDNSCIQMCDIISTLALAINLSFSAGHGQTVNASHIKFQRATSWINFKDNWLTNTQINVYQIRNLTLQLVGQYDDEMRSLSQSLLSSSFINSLSDSQFPSVYDKKPLAFNVIVYSIDILCCFFITVILILYIFFRNEPDIKSTSFALSFFMFIGCYLLLAFAVVLTVEDQVIEVVEKSSWLNLCLAQAWLCGLGVSIPIILATLLVKMLRIYRIFTCYDKVKLGKLSSNVAMVIYTLLVLLPNIVILLVWSVLDTYTNSFSYGQHPGFVEVTEHCDCRHLLVWLSLLLLYFLLLSSCVVFVAIKTRKVRLIHFKDTKKVNSCIFLLLLIVILTLSYWLLFDTIAPSKYAGIVTLYVAHVLSAIICQVFLFVPKVWPPLWRKMASTLSLPAGTISSVSLTTMHNQAL